MIELLEKKKWAALALKKKEKEKWWKEEKPKVQWKPEWETFEWKQKSEKKPNILEYTPDVKSHEGLVQELAKRWWYVIPEWPPADLDYTSKLKENGLRSVEL